MGLYNLDRCLFTGMEIINLPTGFDGIDYRLELGENRFHIKLPHYAKDWKDDSFFRANKYLFHAFLLNNQWFPGKEVYITLKNLEELISTNTYPKTPLQKIENLFHWLYKQQKEEGQIVDVSIKPTTFLSLYFRSISETSFYIDNLHRQGLIERLDAAQNNNELRIRYRVTFAGLEHAIKLETEGEKSKRCFVAMSFNPSTKPIREAIRAALNHKGYEAVIIDEQLIDSDRTINDEIIASLKRCKFCIADFTNHSKGVYFESGFALGQGKKVIYTCSKEQFENAHFDIKPLQHIVYETSEQLTKELIHKIEAYIN